MELVSIERANLGRGEAMTALDRSWLRQLLVARESRRRSCGGGDDMVEGFVKKQRRSC